MKKLEKIVIIVSIVWIVWYFYCWSKPTKHINPITYKGFGWYGYVAEDEINEEVLREIKEVGGNAININVYYEYDLENESFILLSNLTKIKEKIELAHKNNLVVFLSPFVNLVGGDYTAGKISKPEKFLEGARNVSIELAEFCEKNKIEIYAVWNELGLAIHKLPNSTELTNEWLQNIRKEVKNVYRGVLTTKEGVQLDLYEKYDFSGYDCIGLTFYPFTTSFATDPYTNITYAGVESLEEYEIVVKEKIEKIMELKVKYRIPCVILGEIGIDVVGGKFIDRDPVSKNIRAIAYKTILSHGLEIIDGFFFSKFEEEGKIDSELKQVFQRFFQ
ncbi:MAG: hypothetical protein QW040_01775 [Candidatus Aenigmatarchaeota archaeon]